MKQSSIINRAELKRVAVRIRDRVRPFWKADRVAESFIDDCEAELFNVITKKIQAMPTLGKTIK